MKRIVPACDEGDFLSFLGEKEHSSCFFIANLYVQHEVRDSSQYKNEVGNFSSSVSVCLWHALVALDDAGKYLHDLYVAVCRKEF